MNHILKGKVRIIAGKWKGYKLPVLNSPGLRPTTNSMRETLFNWLSSSIISSKCLDCFAGSGALGFEALSRNANKVTLLEKSKKIVHQLYKNIKALKAKNIQVIHIDAFKFLTKPGKAYDIVFIDPPFHTNTILNIVVLLEQNGWLSNSALIYIENEIELNSLLFPKYWHLRQKKLSKHVMYTLYSRNIESFKD